MQCGLLGRKLGHSYSPQIHSHLGEYKYTLIEKEPEDLSDFFHTGNFTGLNVTIPYKKDVIPFCTELSPCAKAIGSVNTIVRLADGKLIGHNTDYFGFETMLVHSGLCVSGKKVLVLGSGGASNTAVQVLKAHGANVIVISRSGDNNYGNLDLHKDAAVIVNATPVGMYPNPGISPVDLSLFPHLEGVLDMVYNPARTKLLMDAEDRGLIAENGLRMLVAQAKESAEWFTGSNINDSVIDDIHNLLKRQMENIILIGMPGCGKSSVGKALAECTGKHLFDADRLIEDLARKSIPDIFSQDGEERFRELETQALEILGKESNAVISTGGGCVTRQRNYRLLHQNGIIFWLQRDIDKLPTDGRPLSQQGVLSQMYQIRKPLYEGFADRIIDNNGSIHDTVERISKEAGYEDLSD